MGVTATLVCIAIALMSLLVFYTKRQLSHWERRGIPHDEPHFPEGNMKGFMKDRHFQDIIKRYYDKFKGTGPFAGFFFFLTHAVIITDLDLVRDILIKDFHNFTDRGVFHNEQDDPLTGNLFGLDGIKWKNLRSKLSPTFTSGKMKFMFPTVVAVGEELQATIGAMIGTEALVEVKDILSRFTVDVIGTCAFGIECHSLNDPNAEFRTMGGKAFTVTRHGRMIMGFMFSFPELARKLRMRLVHEDVHQFFMRVVRETVKYRERHSIQRNDFMSLLIEMKNGDNGISIEQIAAQAFIFFLAGFETTSMAMSLTLFELALNQEIQEKLRVEINEKLAKHDGQFTYECMNEMIYMEKVFKETLRKYSAVTVIMRRSLKDYPTADPKYTIPKGTFVIIPTDAIHRDPEIYPDPEKFDPERFTADGIQSRHPTAWLPFGDGPRNCIGLRFGKMQAYIGLTMLVGKFRFHSCEKTPNPLQLDPTNSGLAVKGGIYLRVERI